MEENVAIRLFKKKKKTIKQGTMNKMDEGKIERHARKGEKKEAETKRDRRMEAER